MTDFNEDRSVAPWCNFNTEGSKQLSDPLCYFFLQMLTKSIFLEKPKLFSSGVFWNGCDFKNTCVCLCVFVCPSVLWVYVCIHMHVHVPLCTLNLIATVFGPDL